MSRKPRIPLDQEYSDNDDDDEHVDSDEEDTSESCAKRSSFIMNFHSWRILTVWKRVLTHCKQNYFVRRRSRRSTTTTGKGTGHSDNGKEAPKTKDNRKEIKAGSKVSLDPSQGATKSQDLSKYEQERRRNIEKNDALMLQLNISLPVAKEGEGIAKPPKNPEKGTKSAKGRGPTTAAATSLQSPTRQQARLKQEPILVAWGGELHCSTPLLPSTHCVYWPLRSMGVMSVMVWLGKTALNPTVAC